MKDKILGMYRTFKHNVLYKDKFASRLVRVCIVGLILSICMLFLLG